jgi:hypothetical protein
MASGSVMNYWYFVDSERAKAHFPYLRPDEELVELPVQL